MLFPHPAERLPILGISPIAPERQIQHNAVSPVHANLALPIHNVRQGSLQDHPALPPAVPAGIPPANGDLDQVDDDDHILALLNASLPQVLDDLPVRNEDEHHVLAPPLVANNLKAMLQVQDHATWGMISDADQYKELFAEYCRINDDKAEGTKCDRVVLTDHQFRAYITNLCQAMVDMTAIVELPDSQSVKKIMRTKNLEFEFLACELIVSFTVMVLESWLETN